MKSKFLCFLILAMIAMPAILFGRTWTRKDGNSVEAEAIAKTETSVTLRLRNGSDHEVQIADLSIDDQAYLKEWTEPKRPIQVLENAVYFKGSWFAIVTEATSCTGANEKAKRMRAHLARPKDKETQEFLVKLAEGLRVWIDGSDSEVEGQWKWSDGEKIEEKFWSKGNPNNYRRRQDHINFNEHGRWNDEYGDMTHKHIVGYIVQWSEW